MKKSTVKYIVGGSMVGFGILLIFIAVCIGGWDTLFNFGGVTIDWDGIHYYDNDSNEFFLPGGSEIMDKDDIKKLNIEMEYGKLIIKTDDVDKIKVDTKNIISNRFSCDQTGDTIKIRYRGGFSFFTWKSDSEITVTLPKDMSFEKVFIANGAGKTDIKNITSDEISMENGAGESTLTDIYAKDKLYLENGAGAITMKKINCGKIEFSGGVGEINAEEVICSGLSVEAGVGSFKFSGEINGNADIDNGIGE
ncbi:MAG: DUF4097 domain-containing protein, partial [Ruminiclostridium sp.]|nr:DUF4097 domain-containing protein [Ruminiclostridium sp.]